MRVAQPLPSHLPTALTDMMGASTPGRAGSENVKLTVRYAYTCRGAAQRGLPARRSPSMKLPVHQVTQAHGVEHNPAPRLPRQPHTTLVGNTTGCAQATRPLLSTSSQHTCTRTHHEQHDAPMSWMTPRCDPLPLATSPPPHPTPAAMLSHSHPQHLMHLLRLRPCHGGWPCQRVHATAVIWRRRPSHAARSVHCAAVPAAATLFQAIRGRAVWAGRSRRIQTRIRARPATHSAPGGARV